MKYLQLIILGFVLAGCSRSTPASETPTEVPVMTASVSPPTAVTETQIPTETPTSTPAPEGDPVLVGAGDIAHCRSEGDEITALLLDEIQGTVFTTGDNAYPDGAPADFAECYDPSWGRHKDRTFPSPGNHDYHFRDGAGYYEYFGKAAGEPGKGYYSYDLGEWHIIALNSNLPVEPGSPQEQWLRQDLAAHPAVCTLAYWHHPRFSSGARHGSKDSMEPLWQALYDFGADVVLAGHDHGYERFALQDPQGNADPPRGIRGFVVGTGGRSFYEFSTPIANSEVRIADTFGVLKLTLHPTSYTWEFVPEPGKNVTDFGTAPCVTWEGLAP